ncbi:YcxB family protein [Asticcacaulis sp. YBE204]|uniref:YcxB family protein n=1 Tax=Asticcacaulis sp. YBE204 TaxID=1282363 RepID=UPI0003C3D942|nr:YcxB family protein [Asticcacaulis sp. YBE204]ESQ79867.1 hypothetical protein AEYBE204_08455 [Asticcacaulis sp. YBE204]
MTETHLSTEPYRLKAGDIASFCGVWAQRNRFNRISLIRFGVVFVVLIIIFAAGRSVMPETYPSDPVLIGVFYLLAAAFWAALISFFLQPLLIGGLQIVSHLLKAAPPEQSVSLDETGFTKHQNGAVKTTEWTEVHDVKETARTLLIFTRPNSALIVPKRAFAAPENEHRFVLAAQQYRDHARTTPTASKSAVPADAEQVF